MKPRKTEYALWGVAAVIVLILLFLTVSRLPMYQGDGTIIFIPSGHASVRLPSYHPKKSKTVTVRITRKVRTVPRVTYSPPRTQPRSTSRYGRK